MNKTRFYEITQAAAKGEDLSVFVPTNAAEAELIANLQGGGGSAELSLGTVGTKISADVFPLSKIYFNTSLTNEQMIEWMYEYCFGNQPTCFDETTGQPMAFYESNGTALIFVAMPTGGGALVIALGNPTTQELSMVIYDSGNLGVDSGFIGWNPQLFADKNYITFDEINSVASFETDEAVLETYSKIMSFGEDFENAVEPLQGTYDGTPMTVNENYTTIDIVALLKEKKLPKIIKVEV